VTIIFDVTINNPFPSGVQQVSNTGTVSGSNFTVVNTDDPAFPGSSDPTVTPVTTTPIVTATKTAALSSDLNGNGIGEAGDRLRYTITMTNGGNTAALAVQFNDTPDTHTSIVAGSVTTSSGTVMSGNAPGDTSVSVDIGTLPVSATVTITFGVSINFIPSGVTSVINSGTVSGSNISPVATDSPSAPGNADPTVFAVAAASAIPTLDAWGLLALLTVLAIVAIRKVAM